MNTTFFLTGETLLFKVYCFEQDKPEKLSRLSSIAYLELIGEDQQPFAQLKIKLQNGVGSGDYFFDSNVPTGNYTLVAYTKWMRNFGESDFFRRTVTVINPNERPSGFDTATVHSSKNSGATASNYNREISIKLNANSYGRRDKVRLELAADTTVTSLSINVRLLENEINAAQVWPIADRKAQTPGSSIHFLPDPDGELISGTVLYQSDGKPLVNEMITLSSPSAHFSFHVSTTDANGRYYFNGTEIDGEYLLLNSVSHPSHELIVKPDPCFLGSYAQFAPPKLLLPTALKELLEKRFLSSQVENAFYAVKKDSVSVKGETVPFFITPSKVYRLDDFARFPTMEDIFREIIPQVVVKLRDEDFSLLIINSTTGFRFEKPPLVLIDGVVVTDANLVLKYDPLLIKTISLVTERYYYGGLENAGIISIQTYEGNAKNLNLSDMVRVNYSPPQSSRIYYSPTYESVPDLSRIPDFRTQLYWNPAIILDASAKQVITFFTNDIAGTYFIEVVGVSATGTQIYWRENFEVR